MVLFALFVLIPTSSVLAQNIGEFASKNNNVIDEITPQDDTVGLRLI